QQVVVLDQLNPGEVNRAREVHWCASGKVLNAARAIHHLGGPVRALTLVGGTVGGAMERDFDRLGVPARWIESAAPTRVCTTIVDVQNRQATELVPNAPAASAAERGRGRVSCYDERTRAQPSRRVRCLSLKRRPWDEAFYIFRRPGPVG